MLRELTIIYEHGGGGWWVATIPEVPGAFSQGRRKAEARESVLDALSELMAARREIALKETMRHRWHGPPGRAVDGCPQDREAAHCST